jgi:molybdate transport system substrate-binding protein
MGNPASVPAGVYGRQWLERLQLWSTVQAKVVPLSNVRAALAAVREGRAQAAIVYVTDARAAPELTLAYLVPVEEAPSITYPAALVRGSREAEARQLMDYLRSADARAAFARASFGVMPQ